MNNAEKYSQPETERDKKTHEKKAILSKERKFISKKNEKVRRHSTYCKRK